MKRESDPRRCLHCNAELLEQSRRRMCSDECKKARKAVTYRAWASAHREQLRSYLSEYVKEWRKSNPDYFAGYYARNKEQRKQETRNWYAANSERHQRVVEKYRKEHPELVRSIGRKSALTRRARKKNALVERVDPKVVFERDRGICGICQKPVGSGRWEVDHIVPLAKGGRHAYDNVQLAHGRCNRVKGVKVDGVAACSLWQ